jgi:hypothetical protein
MLRIWDAEGKEEVETIRRRQEAKKKTANLSIDGL